MDAWGKSAGAGDKIMMLADGNAQVPRAGSGSVPLALCLYLDPCMRDFRPMMPAGSPVFFVNVHVLGSELDKRACTPPRPPVPQFAKALGVELDLTDKGLGVRSRRYAMLVEDQVVKVRQSPHQGCMYCFLAVAAVNPCPSLLAPTAALPPPIPHLFRPSLRHPLPTLLHLHLLSSLHMHLSPAGPQSGGGRCLHHQQCRRDPRSPGLSVLELVGNVRLCWQVHMISARPEVGFPLGRTY